VRESRRVCAIDLLVDTQAREVARVADRQASNPSQATGDLMDAVEAYDLASARLHWVQQCPPLAALAQHEAVSWHTEAARNALVGMLSALRQTDRSSERTA
jgi:hypothetical protein